MSARLKYARDRLAQRQTVAALEAKFALPGRLPAGERILWQGAPDWWALARNALRLRGLSIYLGLVVGWVLVSALRHGLPLDEVAFKTGRAALVAAVPLALATGYAWLAARAAAYTITNRRVVIRMGVGLNLTVNLPFAQIDGAAITCRPDGTGDIAIKLARGSKGLGWVVMWPHARAWHAGQPALRSVPDAARAGQILARALSEAATTSVPLASDARIVDSANCQPDATTVPATMPA